MAKPATLQIKLLSTADTGFFYVTKKNPRTKPEKLELMKYDPKVRKHVLFKEAKINGYVVAIDDTTSFILAEKHAAWSDIARKIAHEVNNPLTPIKLSAERIEKKYKSWKRRRRYKTISNFFC